MRMRRKVCPSALLCASTCQALASEMTFNSSGNGDLAAVIMPASGNRPSGTNVIHAATIDSKGSPVVVLSGSADSEDNVSIASIMFPPMKACTTFPRPWLCTVLWAASVVELGLDSAHVVQLGDSVMVDSSPFAVSLFLGDVGNFVLLCDRSTLRNHAHGSPNPFL